MIHRESRDRLALALRRYAAGQITNDELDDTEVDWRDRGAVAVKQMAWNLYDDIHEHFVESDLPRGSEARTTVARWIAFLHSDNEYLWPEYSFIQFINLPMNVLTLGWWEKHKRNRWRQFLEAGDFAVWPFITKTDLATALNHPRLLAGSRHAEQITAGDVPCGHPTQARCLAL